MKRRYGILIAGLAVLCLGVWWQVRAQSVYAQEAGISDRIAGLESKLELLRVSQENTQKEIAGKLERILTNQAEILRQLEIVKVRATRK